MKKRLLTIVPFLLGLFLCGYPLISSLVERQHQQNAVATYKGMINKESLETLKESTENYADMHNEWTEEEKEGLRIRKAARERALKVSKLQEAKNIKDE